MKDDLVDKEAYIEAVKALLDGQKFQGFFVGAPLLAIASQLRWLQSLESFWISVLITISVFCFLIVGAFLIYFIDWVRQYIAILQYEKTGKNAENSQYFQYLISLNPKGRSNYTEANITEITKRVTMPLLIFMIGGWVSFILAILIAVWF